MAEEKEEIKKLTLEQLMESSYKCSPQVVSDLKSAFGMDFTIERACRFAKINIDTYYEWINKSDEFAQQMAAAQDEMFNDANEILKRKLIVERDADVAKWFMSRRDKKRYSERVDSNVTVSDIKLVIGDDDNSPIQESE